MDIIIALKIDKFEKIKDEIDSYVKLGFYKFLIHDTDETDSYYEFRKIYYKIRDYYPNLWINPILNINNYLDIIKIEYLDIFNDISIFRNTKEKFLNKENKKYFVECFVDNTNIPENMMEIIKEISECYDLIVTDIKNKAIEDIKNIKKNIDIKIYCKIKILDDAKYLREYFDGFIYYSF